MARGGIAAVRQHPRCIHLLPEYSLTGEMSLGRHKEKAAGRRPLSPTDHDQTDLMFGTNLRGLHSTLSFGFCFVRAVIDNGRRRGRWL
jgi:hypothetical protein